MVTWLLWRQFEQRVDHCLNPPRWAGLSLDAGWARLEALDLDPDLDEEYDEAEPKERLENVVLECAGLDAWEAVP